MNFAPFKKQIVALESAQKFGPDGVYNGQYFSLFAFSKFPTLNPGEKSNFLFRLFACMYTSSGPVFHADSNDIIRFWIGAKLAELLQFFCFANSQPSIRHVAMC